MSRRRPVLSRLERDVPATASSLARAEGMRPQSMAATVLALTEARLVTARPIRRMAGGKRDDADRDSCRA